MQVISYCSEQPKINEIKSSIHKKNILFLHCRALTELQILPNNLKKILSYFVNKDY